MPNETRHTLHVMGKPAIIDRWLRFSLMKPSDLPDEWDDGYPRISFPHLCPIKAPRKKRRRPDIPSAVVYYHWRTRLQASIFFTCAWDYPKDFFQRVPRYWKGLSVWCMVEGEMNDFGGVITILKGRLSNLVRDYDSGYNADEHAAKVKRAMDQWWCKVRQASGMLLQLRKAAEKHSWI